jgi:hypothetical protein
MRGRYGGLQKNIGFHIFMRVSGCVIQNASVRLLVAQEQVVLVFGHCLVTISLIPMNNDLKVSMLGVGPGTALKRVPRS